MQFPTCCILFTLMISLFSVNQDCPMPCFIYVLYIIFFFFTNILNLLFQSYYFSITFTFNTLKLLLPLKFLIYYMISLMSISYSNYFYKDSSISQLIHHFRFNIIVFKTFITFKSTALLHDYISILKLFL